MENEKNEVLTVKEIVCGRCGAKFEMAPAEQKFYVEHNFTMPKKCPACRKLRRQLTKCVCVDCNAEFDISELEKEYYLSRRFQIPKRCKSCRDIKSRHNAKIKNTDSDDEFF